MQIIGINGRLHSGKDEAFKALDSIMSERYGAYYGFAREGFADRMKLSGVRALGFNPATIEEAVEIANRIKDNGIVQTFVNSAPSPFSGATEPDDIHVTGREFWQRYGTEAHRQVDGFGEDVWVDVLLPQPSSLVQQGVPSDSPWAQQHSRSVLKERFPGIDLLVITDCRFDNEAQRIRDLGGEVWALAADKRLGPLPDDSHVSEYGVDWKLVTRLVDNNGSLEQFRENVREAFDERISF